MNQNLLPAMQVRWLTKDVPEEAVSFFSSAFEPQRQDLQIDPSIGNGWAERFPLQEGISLLRAHHNFRPESAGQLIPLGEFKIELPDTALEIQTVHCGTACHREFFPPAELIFKPGHDFFRYSRGFHAIPSVDSTGPCEMTAVRIMLPTLRELIGTDIAEQLIKTLGLTHQPAVKVIPIPLHVSASLRSSISPTLTGQLRRLFAQAKVLEYLCALVDSVSKKPVQEVKGNRKRAIVRELHDYLVNLDGKLPTLDELTIRCGISARWLNEAFSMEYGKTIYSFITDHRLNEAHTALMTGNVAIKGIAERLGYSHVSHFTIAFKRKFGYPPGSLRRRQKH